MGVEWRAEEMRWKRRWGVEDSGRKREKAGWDRRRWRWRRRGGTQHGDRERESTETSRRGGCEESGWMEWRLGFEMAG